MQSEQTVSVVQPSSSVPLQPFDLNFPETQAVKFEQTVSVLKIQISVFCVAHVTQSKAYGVITADAIAELARYTIRKVRANRVRRCSSTCESLIWCSPSKQSNRCHCSRSRRKPCSLNRTCPSVSHVAQSVTAAAQSPRLKPCSPSRSYPYSLRSSESCK